MTPELCSHRELELCRTNSLSRLWSLLMDKRAVEQMPLKALQVRSGDRWSFCVAGRHTQTCVHTYINAYPSPLYERSSLIDEEIDGKLQCPSWWMTSFGPMCWSCMPNRSRAHPPPSLSPLFLLTIDQWDFCTPASFEFNAWGRRAVDVALYCLSLSLGPLPPFHSPIHLYLEGSKAWQIQWHSVCLPSCPDNHSVLNGPSPFRWIIVYTRSIIGAV